MRSALLLAAGILLAACAAPAGGLSPAGGGPAPAAGASASNKPAAGGAPPAAGGAPPAASTARTLPPGIAALVDAAKREGRVVVYGTNSSPDEEERVEQAFRDFYGFGLDLSFESGLHPQKVAELIPAMRSGVRSGLDLFWSSETILTMLDQPGLLRDGSWLAPLELGPDDRLMRDKGARIHDSFLANVIYNTRRVRAEEAPRRYQDLLDPRWQGAMVSPRTTSQWVYTAYVFGEDAATELVEGIARQRMAFVPTYPDATGRVAAGEYLLGMGQHAERESRKGAPLADAPLDIGILIPWGMAMMPDAEHAAAATLLVYFLTQPEGQRVIDQTWAISRASSPDTALWRVAQGKQLVQIPLDWLEREDTRLRRKYADILGIR